LYTFLRGHFYPYHISSRILQISSNISFLPTLRFDFDLTVSSFQSVISYVFLHFCYSCHHLRSSSLVLRQYVFSNNIYYKFRVSCVQFSPCLS
jgi:hypothetical protein